jgi:hypothetical protein
LAINDILVNGGSDQVLHRDTVHTRKGSERVTLLYVHIHCDLRSKGMAALGFASTTRAALLGFARITLH